MPRALLTQDIDGRLGLEALLKEKGWDITCRSFIATVPVNFDKELERYSWVFFSSKNAVKHFFEQSPILSEKVKIAAIGKGTAQQLSAYTTVHFTGKSTDTEEVGKVFSEGLSPIDEVLFPIGRESLRTIQKQLPSVQINDLICYETRLVPVEFPAFDVYVFSSPSNVKSFLAKNSLAPGARVFSFGASTSKSLRTFGIEQAVELQDYSDESMASAIISA